MFYTRLTNRALLFVSGADAESFLQGLISNDMRKLSDGLLYAAMLTPQGKFLHDFFLLRRDGGIVIDCEATREDDLRKRLSLYKLRADVAITPLESEGVVAVWQENSSPCRGEVGRGALLEDSRSARPHPNPPPQGEGICVDPRLAEMGYRAVGEVEAIMHKCAAQGYEAADNAAYEAHRLALGVPDGAQDMLIEKSFLLEVGFEALHGVDFNKGCYVGQEVTARSKFRGQVRKHLYQVQADADLPPRDTLVTLEGAEVGVLRSHAGKQGLAIIRIEAVEKVQAGTAVLHAGDVPLTVRAPAWAGHMSQSAG